MQTTPIPSSSDTLKNDFTQRGRNINLKVLDNLNLAEKIKHVLLTCQPFDCRLQDKRSPAFPKQLVPNTKVASRRIMEAAKHICQLWGCLHPEDKAWDRRRSLKHVREWRDILTHPEIYRKVFSEWIGYVYVRRNQVIHNTMDIISERSRIADPTHSPSAAWDIPMKHWPLRGAGVQIEVNKFNASLPDENKNNKSIPVPVGMYTHCDPERFGHRTKLVDAEVSSTARIYGNEVHKILHGSYSDTASGGGVGITVGDYPGVVVRLQDLGWYLGGFLSSVIVWTQLALVETPRILQRGPLVSLENVGCDFVELLTSTAAVLDPQLHLAWHYLAKLLQNQKCEMFSPIPDLIRVPQEWCLAMSGPSRGDKVPDQVLFRGLSGKERRSYLRIPTRDVGLPWWFSAVENNLTIRNLMDKIAVHQTTSGETRPTFDKSPFAYWKKITAYLCMLQDEHMTKIMKSRVQQQQQQQKTGLETSPPHLILTERYLPIPEVPNPLTGLYIPWTSVVPTAVSNSNTSYKEIVHTLASTALLGLYNIGICGLETGLSLEQWGGLWNANQRDSLLEMFKETLENRKLNFAKAILSGQSIPYWEDPARKLFNTDSIMILDENGPMGRGYRMYNYYYNDDLQNSNNGGSSERFQRWVCFERFTAVESMEIQGPPPDEVGRWEDSGIEMPQKMFRRVIPSKHVASHTWKAYIAAATATTRRRIRTTSPNKGSTTTTAAMSVLSGPWHRRLRVFTARGVLPPPDPDTLKQMMESLESSTFLHRRYMGGADASSFLPTRFTNVSSPASRSVRLNMWKMAADRCGSRVWNLEILEPWPVISTITGADLSKLNGTSISLAPVIRDLWFERSKVANPTWLENLLAMPINTSLGLIGGNGSVTNLKKNTPRHQQMEQQMINLLSVKMYTPEIWLEHIINSGSWASLFPTARITLSQIGFTKIRFFSKGTQMGISNVLIPGTPLPQRTNYLLGIGQLDVKPTKLIHYPNLTSVCLSRLELEDIPKGLLDLAISGKWNRPSPQHFVGARRVRKSILSERLIFWDLSNNNIQHLSEDTLESLVWLIILEYHKATSYTGPKSTTHPEFLRFRSHVIPTRYYINLWGNPIMHQPGVDVKTSQKTNKQTGEIVETIQDLHLKEYIRPRLSYLFKLGKSKDLPQRLTNVKIPSLEYITDTIAHMFVYVHPLIFEREMNNQLYIKDNHLYQWFI